ncbi:putative non-specific serine/threonine protein kinase [Helianthus debilis subsp. tardiflorus]
MIPSSLSSLKGLVELDISHNNLSGQIPNYLELFDLEYLNLLHNDFEGEVPTLGVFANESAFSIFGNSRLCCGLIERGLPKCSTTNKHKKSFPLFVVSHYDYIHPFHHNMYSICLGSVHFMELNGMELGSFSL